MAEPTPTTATLYAAAAHRLSCYTLTASSPIPDARIHELVNQAIHHAPSSFNVQSARAVILLKTEHTALWDLADSVAEKTQPDAYKSLAKMVSGFRGAYGTVLWFEDQIPLDALAKKQAMFGHLVPAWSDVSSGMHQFLVWTALELEGLGCNLQHFNFMPEFSEGIKKKWELPDSWELKAQLVFGQPKEGLVRGRERTYLPVEERVKVFGAE